MPLVIDEDPRAVGAFDVQTAATLYWKNIPVVLKLQDRDETTEELSFRILSGVTKHNHNLRVLRIHISSEADHFFLHTLEVSEEEFQSLKVEQGILVDFGNFPGKIISLLERCMAPAEGGDASRFQAVLSVKGGESVFRIVETNDFKQLPHITLSFRPGNDFAVKQFLAFRLAEVKANNADLTSELARTKDGRSSAEDDVTSLRQQLAALKEAHDSHVREAKAAAMTLQAAAHEERARERAALKEQMERERSDSEARLQEQLAAAARRGSELDGENRRLRDAKYELDSRVSELSHKLGAAEGTVRSLEEECSRLRAAHKQAAADKHSADIQLNEARAKVIALEEKATAQAEIIEQQKARLRDLEAAAKQWEARCSDLREAAAAHEARAKEAAGEVLKGNQIIEKLTGDVRLSKEKSKRKQAIIMRQEEEVQQREAALAAAQRELTGLRQALDAARDEAGSAKAEVSDLRSKLDDSKAQLQSNEQMIRWLNQQVTEAQLSVTAVPGSRYAFKPTAPAIGASGSGMLPPAPAVGGSLGAGAPSGAPSRYGLNTPSIGTAPPASNAYRNITNMAAGGPLAAGGYKAAGGHSEASTPLSGMQRPYSSGLNLVA